MESELAFLIVHYRIHLSLYTHALTFLWISRKSVQSSTVELALSRSLPVVRPVKAVVAVLVERKPLFVLEAFAKQRPLRL